MAKKNGTQKTKRRPMIPIEVSPEVEKIIDGEVKNTGMSRKAFVEKVIRWIAGQDDVTRATILESIPESLRVDVARLALERMAGQSPAKK